MLKIVLQRSSVGWVLIAGLTLCLVWSGQGNAQQTDPTNGKTSPRREESYEQLSRRIDIAKRKLILNDDVIQLAAVIEVAGLVNSKHFEKVRIARLLAQNDIRNTPLVFPADTARRFRPHSPTVGEYFLGTLVKCKDFFESADGDPDYRPSLNVMRVAGASSTVPALQYLVRDIVIGGLSNVPIETLEQIVSSNSYAIRYIGDSGSARLLGQTYDVVRDNETPAIRAGSEAFFWSIGVHMQDYDVTQAVVTEATRLLERSRRRGRR